MPPLKSDVLEAAATWYVDLLAVRAEDPLHQVHQQWLLEAPAHQQAWDRLIKLQAQMASVEHPLAHKTLVAARLSRRQSIKALSVLLTLGASGLALYPQRHHAAALIAGHQTGTGMFKEVGLADGGKLQMNTATALDIDYNANERSIYLHRGEILISTAADNSQRPFYVYTPEGRIEALGTRFSVFSNDGYSKVNVFEQAVDIQPRDTLQGVILSAGQSRSFSHSELLFPEILDGYADAWTRGLLIVSNWRLDRFANEVNRYRRGILNVDPAVAALRISGAFNVKDIPSVLENLMATLPVNIRYRTRYWAKIEAR